MKLDPTIILVEPQLGENIGAAARAMWNCGLSTLRLVAPRDGWPNSVAQAAATVHAAHVVEAATVYDTTAAAIHDCHSVYATTARPRDGIKEALSLESAVRRMQKDITEGKNVGLLFGGERTGLHNDDVAHANALICIDLNPDYASLNLGQAVLLVAYQWYRQMQTPPDSSWHLGNTTWAQKQAVDALLRHLIRRLDEKNYFIPLAKREHMVDSLMSLFHRHTWTEQDMNTLHGMIMALTRKELPS